MFRLMGRAAVFAAVTMTFHGVAQAQALASSTPMMMVVPAAAGSAPDIVARLLSDELQQRLGQPFIVENKPGAGGIIAVMAAKSAPARANTLLFVHAAIATVTPLTYRAAKFDLATDFEPIAIVADTPMMFVANPAKGPKSLADAIAQAKATPDGIALGSTARGSIPHLAGVLLGQMTGTQFNNVAMNASGQALQSVIAGDTVMSVDGIAPLLPMVKAGRIRALAVTSNRALPGLEGLPLAKETVPGLELTGWFMLLANKGTPQARIQEINSAVNAALKSPDMVKKLQNTANYPVGGSPTEARQFLESEKAKLARAVRQAGLTPE
ncbi:tripartite tricarboxylate transporter substrate binding protein [Variovorax sp. Sphag1AA]|uniref:Bug family tripartite tricarboxylate transporter substrate binding protein n=1 Tax=Variovorax sp. Sphag1AA TaxID=2587027 RepID=UPI00160AF282|nr:tripartite tricarboxylate transporter substrate binding protein [Variovorax sp. Sphag1AA]MBB3178206.1 tripartite-type tricarboxylate transporter receptor subunit TctC [Variovorax sp. Sphag1AA]